MTVTSVVKSFAVMMLAICAMAVSIGVFRTKADEVQVPDDQRIKLLEVFVSEFVEVTPGRGQFPKSFEMGSADGPENERPPHKVTFDYEFAMAKHEVPQNLYAAVMGKDPSRWKGPRNSVEEVSFADAQEFCKAATRLLREKELIRSDEVIRLPSEAEWEYCCRAGTESAYSFGPSAQGPDDKENKASLLDPYAWHTGNAAGNDPPVGALKPNAWGLYDMHGYLWEFVEDDATDSYEGAPANGSPWKSDTAEVKDRIVRGGSWRERFDRLRSSTRQATPYAFHRDDTGFRCVKVRAED